MNSANGRTRWIRLRPFCRLCRRRDPPGPHRRRLHRLQQCTRGAGAAQPGKSAIFAYCAPPAKTLTLIERDDLLSLDGQQQLYEFLSQPPGRLEVASRRTSRSWHAFAGTRNPDLNGRIAGCRPTPRTVPPNCRPMRPCSTRLGKPRKLLRRPQARALLLTPSPVTAATAPSHHSTSPIRLHQLYYPNPNGTRIGVARRCSSTQDRPSRRRYPKPNRMIGRFRSRCIAPR